MAVPRRGRWTHALVGATLLLLGTSALLGGVGSALGAPPLVHSTALAAPAPAGPRGVPLGAAPAAPGSPVHPDASAGSVARTLLVNYNGSLPGGFPSTVRDLNVGPGASVPSTGLLWLPELPGVIGVPGALPPSAPAVLFDPATDAYAGIVPALANASDLVYDPANGLLYVAQPLNNTVGVFDPVSETWVGPALPVGQFPYRMVLDAATAELLVANLLSDNLSVINTTTESVVGSGVALSAGPIGLALNPVNQTLFVAYRNSSLLTILNASSFSLIFAQVLPGPAGDIGYAQQSDTVGVTVPAGGFLTLVNATSFLTKYGLIQVGAGATATLPTPDGQFFLIANSSGADVEAVNATSGTLLGTTSSCGAGPGSFDEIGGTVYVWARGSRNLTAVWSNGSAVSVSSPTLGAAPSAIAYSASLNELLVTSAADNTLVSLSPTTLGSVAAPISFRSQPLSVALGDTPRYAYVGLTNGTARVDLNTSAVLFGNPLLGSTEAMVYDPGTGLLWALSSLVGLVALRTPNLTVALSVGIGAGQAGIRSLALDPATDQLFVPVNSSGVESIAVVDGNNGTVVNGSVLAAPGLTSLTYDAADGTVYGLGNNITLLNATRLTPAGPLIPIAPHSVAGTIVYDASRESVYATAFNAPFGTGVVSVLDGRSVSASYGGETAIPVGESPLSAAVAPSSGGSEPAEIWVGNEQAGTVSIIATSPPSIVGFSALPAAVDVGVPTTLYVALTNGAGPTAIDYTNLPPGCTSSSVPLLACTPQVAGDYSVTVTVTDSLGGVARASTILSVGPQLSVTAAFDLSTFPSADVDFPIGIAASAQGGTGPYTYAWAFGDGSSATGRTVLHTYNTTGVFALSLTATDTTGATTSARWALVVSAPPSMRIVAASTTTDAGLPLSFSSSAVGGSGANVSTLWTFGDGTSETGGQVVHSWSSPGLYNLTAQYVDGLGQRSTQSTEVLVNPDPSGDFSVTGGSAASPARPGTPFFYNATPVNGSGPFVVTWSFGDGSSAVGSTVTHAYAASGSYTIRVTEVDAVGAAVNATLVVMVLPSPASTSSGASSSFGGGVFLGLVVGAALAAIVIYAAGRKRRRDRAPPPPPSPYVPPERPDWKEDA